MKTKKSTRERDKNYNYRINRQCLINKIKRGDIDLKTITDRQRHNWTVKYNILDENGELNE